MSQSGNLAMELGIVARGRARLLPFRLDRRRRRPDRGRTAPAIAAQSPPAVAHVPQGVGRRRTCLRGRRSDLVEAESRWYCWPRVAACPGRRRPRPTPVRSPPTVRGARRRPAATAGIILVATPTELVEATRVAAQRRPPRRPALPSSVRGPVRLGIVADGGGHGVVAADLAGPRGSTGPGSRPPWPARLAAGFRRPRRSPTRSTWPGPASGIWHQRRLRVRLAGSGEVDAVLLTGYFGGYAERSRTPPWCAEAGSLDAIAAVLAARLPVFVHRWAGPDGPPPDRAGRRPHLARHRTRPLAMALSQLGARSARAGPAPLRRRLPSSLAPSSRRSSVQTTPAPRRFGPSAGAAGVRSPRADRALAPLTRRGSAAARSAIRWCSRHWAEPTSPTSAAWR